VLRSQSRRAGVECWGWIRVGGALAGVLSDQTEVIGIDLEGRRTRAMNITKPNRATHTYRQKLDASPATVFPLYCPVRETEWADGWIPELVISSSGIAERDCVFVTSD